MAGVVVLAVATAFVLALTALLLGTSDFTLRTREDFHGANTSKGRWRAVQLLAVPLGLVPYFVSGRDNWWLLVVPVTWALGQLAYLIVVRPRLQRLRPLGSGRVARTALLYAALAAVALVLMFPLYITVVNSLLRIDEITSRPPTFFPFHPVWSLYNDAWTDGHLGRYLWNTAVMTAMIVVFQVGTAIISGYAFAFLEFPLKRVIFFLFLGTLMIPFEVTIVTNLTTVVDLDLYNTYLGLAIPFLATGFGAFLMRQSFLTLPRDLQDAARLDGYGHLRFMARVAIPLVRPSVAALAVFAFFSSWNQYLWPFLVTKDDRLRTVQIGVKQLRATQLDKFNVTYAGLVIAMVPLVIVLIVFQKQLIRGLTAGAVKG